MEENELQELLIDTQKEYTRSNKVKDKIIMLLIVLMFLEAVAGMQNTNALATQLSDCCCTTQRNIDAVRYENARNTCDIVNAIKADGDATRALMTQNEIQNLRDQLQTANFQLSQQAQNATLISTLRPTPIPAYQTCSPYESAHMYSHQYNCCGC